MKIPPAACSAAPAQPHRHGRAPGALLLGAAALLGCASADPPAWQVQPLLRSGASSSAALRDGYTRLAQRDEYDGRWLQAAQAWQKAVQADPSNPALHTALGVALAQAGRPLDAVAPLRRAVALPPGSAQSLNNLGYALWLAGQPAEAMQVLKAALAIEPAHRAALANLALGDPARAHAAPAGPQPMTVPAGPQPMTVPAGPQPMAVPAGPQPVAVPAGPQPMVVPAGPQPMADPAGPQPASAQAVATVPAAGLPLLAVQTRPNLAALGVAEPGRHAVEAAPSGAAHAGGTTAPAPARIAIANGMGVPGAAARLRALLAGQGLPQATLYNLPPYQQARTVVQYRAGFAAVARQVAARIPGGAALSEVPLQGHTEDVRVVLGRDRRTALALCMAPQHCPGQAPRWP